MEFDGLVILEVLLAQEDVDVGVALVRDVDLVARLVLGRFLHFDAPLS